MVGRHWTPGVKSLRPNFPSNIINLPLIICCCCCLISLKVRSSSGSLSKGLVLRPEEVPAPNPPSSKRALLQWQIKAWYYGREYEIVMLKYEEFIVDTYLIENVSLSFLNACSSCFSFVESSSSSTCLRSTSFGILSVLRTVQNRKLTVYTHSLLGCCYSIGFSIHLWPHAKGIVMNLLPSAT